ncbi:hypothetical protein C5167_040822 [Papaver somniferum]|uniref:Uncharacterized protein n=1 Tax=Papaver somniferum TaxID=3469 RepID=A0A4Y7IK84_PAPSO|nr:hypothetical protein C5167_040822 [Papaver somniferum]
MSTRQYLVLQKTCADQEKSLRFSRKQHNEVVKKLTLYNEKIIHRKNKNDVNMNKLQEQHTQLKGSHDILVKENASLSQDEKKIQSCLQGLIGDDFDKCMEDMENGGHALSQYFISQRDASERSYQSTVQKLRSVLTKAHKERGRLSVALSSSRDSSNRRCIYLEKLMEVAVENTKKNAVCEVRIKSQDLADRVCLTNSLFLLDVEPFDVDDDETLPDPDSDYYHESGDYEETLFHGDQPTEDKTDGDHPKDPNPNIDPEAEAEVEISAPEQNMPQNDL